jgi:cytochrome c biogenesis protein CcmG/thiol:disulfide interchange protein DsbE
MESKRLKLWFLIPLILFVGLIVMLFFRLGKPTQVVTNTALERPVPTFELPLLSDTSRTVTDAQMPTSPYLINIWGSWCPTCVYEHPFFLELKERGIDTVGVNYKDEVGDALNYLNELGDPYLMSVQDYSGQFALDLGLTGAPETFVVDSKGIIRQHIVGEVNENNWQSRINPCLEILQQAADNKVDAAKIAEVCQ